MFKYEVTVDEVDSFISKLSGHMTIEDSKIIVSKIKSERKRSRSSSRTSSSQDKDKKVTKFDKISVFQNYIFTAGEEGIFNSKLKI